MESFRASVLEKKYMKFFALAIILLSAGIILIAVGNLYNLYADPSTPEEIEFLYTLPILTTLFLQLGLVMFCFSAFWGAVSDTTLSEEVRRGMVFSASIAIIALALLMIFGRFYIF